MPLPARNVTSSAIRDCRPPESRSVLRRGAAARLHCAAMTPLPPLTIPDSELEERFVRASGPGGQNVNKVASAVELRFDVRASATLPEAVRDRLLARRDRRMTDEGVLVIQAQRFRTQERNREDARERLQALIEACRVAPKKRIATKPTRGSQERRLGSKRERAQVKRERASRRWEREP